MTMTNTLQPSLSQQIEQACRRIAPLWPLKHFVAVSPYFGMVDEPMEAVDRRLRRILGSGLSIPRSYLQEQLRSGRLTRAHIEIALSELESSLSVSEILMDLEHPSPPLSPAPLLIPPIRSRIDGSPWESIVIDRITPVLASWFDMGQALWKNPWKSLSLYQAWRSQALIDKSPLFLGIRKAGQIIAELPETPAEAIQQTVELLPLPQELEEDRLHAALLSVGGWAAWSRYRLWQAELRGESDRTMEDLLAIRLAWETILYASFPGEALKKLREETIEGYLKNRKVRDERVEREQMIDRVLRQAFETGYRAPLFARLAQVSPSGKDPIPLPRVRAVFCIDVRSEVFRRSLEAVAPDVETGGFAGFFGIPAAVSSIGTHGSMAHLPVLFSPAYDIEERPPAHSPTSMEDLKRRRERRLGLDKTWKIFKGSASSTFSFVEAAGILAAGKLLVGALGLGKDNAPPRHRGLDREESSRLSPDLDFFQDGKGIPLEDRPRVALSVLKNMGITDRFPRIVLLVGHGSTTVNNPQASALDCGACAGQSGEASARIAAALLNDPLTRGGLAALGIEIPETTHFLPALHDTVTDRVTFFDTDRLPASHREDLARLDADLEKAGEVARQERALRFNMGGRDKESRTELLGLFSEKSKNWAEVRPEWALAGNASFIVAPRTLTRNIDLQGRSFLHDYDWQADTSFETLELILTGPLVVGHWINMQYYGSVVDNTHFGSGNKVLHNVVGGAVGVLEGNGGDLRTGLALQSLHDGERFIHEPLRLHVLVAAPSEAIRQIVERHALLKNLVKGGWILVYRLIPGALPEPLN
ncbi:MAG: YbcC family protein [Leptospirillia bacterium]